MEKEGKDPKKQAKTNYWLQAFLGFGATALLYTIIKVARKGKPTVKGAVASGMGGSIGTPLAVWLIPKLGKMENQAQATRHPSPEGRPELDILCGRRVLHC